MGSSVPCDRTSRLRAQKAAPGSRAPVAQPTLRTRPWQIFDGAATLGFVVLWCAFAARVVSGIGFLEATLWVALFAVPAFLAADLAAGLLHWFADTFFAPSTPLIGGSLIRAFREHHTDPRGIARRGIVEVSGLNCFACIGILSLGFALDPAALAGRAALVALLWFALAIALTNLFHRWAHAERLPLGVAWLQREGWILSPEKHEVHHSGRHDRAYCVTTGWLNPLLDRSGFFPALERSARWLTRGLVRSRLAKGTRAN